MARTLPHPLACVRAPALGSFVLRPLLPRQRGAETGHRGCTRFRAAVLGRGPCDLQTTEQEPSEASRASAPTRLQLHKRAASGAHAAPPTHAQLRAHSRMAAPKAQLRLTPPSCSLTPCVKSASPPAPHAQGVGLGRPDTAAPCLWAELPRRPACGLLLPPLSESLKSHTGVSRAALSEPPAPLTSSPQDTYEGLACRPPAPRPEDRRVSRAPGGAPAVSPRPCSMWGPVETARVRGSRQWLGLWSVPMPPGWTHSPASETLGG